MRTKKIGSIYIEPNKNNVLRNIILSGGDNITQNKFGVKQYKRCNLVVLLNNIDDLGANQQKV
jgi:hypothetical protein